MLPFSSTPLAHCAGFPFQRPEWAHPHLQLLLHGIKRATADKPGRSCLPITPAILRRVWQVVTAPPHSHNQTMLWAAMNTCFFGFLRAGDTCASTTSSFNPSWHLCVGNVALDIHTAPSKICITIKASKTFRQGVTITLGETSHVLCPMTAILRYLAR